MPVSAVNGAELGWERSGSGPPLLFCNGSGRTLADAQPMLEYLAGEFDVLSWDYRGFGPSDLPGGAYSMADLAGDVEGLLQLAGWDACRVVGISFGGMVAQEFAVTHPETVERLALLCTSSGGEGGSSYPLQQLLALPVAQRAAAGLKLVDSRWSENWFDAHPSDRAVAERFAPKGPPEPANAAAHQAQLEARAGHDVWDRLPSITCPTLVASGRYDGIAPVENGRAIASRIPHAEFRDYEGGHAFLVQDPAAVGDLLGFLDDSRSRCHVIRYFAYGSNMDPGQMGERCPSARLVGPARLIDFRLAFTRESRVTYPGSGVADVIASPGSVVWGVVYSVDEGDLGALDRLEGVGTAYARKQIDVVDEQGNTVPAVTYMVVGKSGREFQPTAEYMSRVIGGARACGLGRDYVELLESACRGTPGL